MAEDLEQEAFLKIKLDDTDLKRSQVALEKRIRSNKAAQKELNEEFKKTKEGTKAYDELVKKSVTLKNEQKLLGVEQANFNRELKNTSQAGQTMKELTKDVGNFKIKATDSYNEAIAKNNLLRQTLKKTKGAFGGNTKEVINLKAALESNNKTLINFDKNVNSGSRNVGRYKEDIGDLANNFGLFPGPLQKAIALLKIFRITLISTGIGAIVVALGALIAGFLGTQRGVDALNKVMRPLGAIFDRIIGVVQDLSFLLVDKLKAAFENPVQAIKDLGATIVEHVVNSFLSVKVLGNAVAALMRGEFSTAAKLAGDAVIQLGTGVTNGTDKIKAGFDSISASVAEANKIGEAIDTITKSIELQEIALAKSTDRLKLISKQQNDIAEDTTKSGKEQAEAAQKAIDAQRELEVLEVGLLNNKIKRLKIEQQLNDTSRESQLELANLEGELFRKQTAIQEAVTTLRNKRNIALKKAATEEVDIERGLLEELKPIQAERQELEIATLDNIKLAKDSARQSEADSNQIHNELELVRLQEFLQAEEEIRGRYIRSTIDNGLNFINEFFSGKSQARVKDLEEEKQKLQQEIIVNRTTGNELIKVQENILGIENEISEERSKTRREFLKGFLKDTIKAVEAFLITQAIKTTAGSLAQADSIATFGATGLVRAGIIITAIKAAGAGLSGLVDRFEDGGVVGQKQFKVGGNYHSQGGTTYHGSDGNVVEFEKDEILTVLKRNNHAGINALSRENVNRGGIDFAKSFNSRFFQEGGIPSPPRISNVVKIGENQILAKLSIEQLLDEINKFNTTEDAGTV